MKGRLTGWLGCTLVLAWLVVVGRAEEERSPEARGFHLNLGLRNQEKDYVAMEEWVFEAGLEDGVRRRRVEEGVWALTRRDHRQRYDDEKAVWVDRYLARLEEECGDRWWAWLLTGEVLDEMSGAGVMVDGKFRRGRGRWEETVYSDARDEAVARQALVKAMGMVRGELEAGRATGEDLACVCVALAGLFDVTGGKVLERTDLAVVPEVSEEPPWKRWTPDRFLVDGRNPVVGPDDAWRLPVLRERFEDAETDGERKYGLLHEAVESAGGPGGPRTVLGEARLDLAMMWHDLLGVDGLVSAGHVYLEGTESEFDPEAPGEFELHTLKDHETIVVGVHGPDRRVIPEQARYLATLRGLVENEATPMDHREQALDLLLRVLADRYQYDGAEAVANAVLAQRDASDEMRSSAEEYLEEIAPDMMFVTPPQFPVGQPVGVEVVTRGVDAMRMELWKLDLEKLLARGAWGRGMRHEHQEVWEMALGGGWHWGIEPKDVDACLPFYQRVAVWTEPVRMKGNHMQTLGRVAVPAREAGSYVLVAQVRGERRIQPLQVARSIVLSVHMEAGPGWRVDGEGRANLFLLDAVTGRPVEGARVESVRDGDQVASVSDHQGYLMGMGRGGELLVRRPGMAPELLQVEGGWLSEPPKEDEVRSFFVTNQPLYRPGQTVEFAGWLKRPHWRSGKWGGFEAGSEVEVRVTDPVGVVVFEKKIVLDEYGGFSGSVALPVDMVLGDCKVHLAVSDMAWARSEDPFDDDAKEIRKWEDLESGWGRDWLIKVGEFRKPDFRVEVEPETGGVRLGAVVRASYNSGEPVKGGVVKARVRGWPMHMNLFPNGEWDELYGSGYDWSLPRTPWLRGWERWGIWSEEVEDWDSDAPTPDQPIGFVLEGVTDAEGVARLEFPQGALPMPEHFEYNCTLRVGVREFTGRSVGAETEFYYSGRPHEAFLRPERRFYRAGETVRVGLWTMDAKREPVAGAGVVRLEAMKLSGKEVTLERVWEKSVETAADGRGEVTFVPPGAGQFRCVFQSGGGERGFVLEVLGDRAGPGRYDGVQLIPECAVTGVGEEIEVLVQTEVAAATVWLCEQMPDGQRRTPRLVTTKDQEALVRFPVTRSGVPEFYLLAATVVDGKLKKAKCRIVVPPVETRLKVAMAARPERAAPGDAAEVEVAVTDAAGAPGEAALAVTAFDRSLADLGGDPPNAGRTMRDRFEGEVWPESSTEAAWRNEYAIVRLDQPGVFFERGDLGGTPRWEKESRFERVGLHLWVAYEPPELPNSIGGRNGDDGMGVFPVTPATPRAYSPYSQSDAADAELSEAEKAGMAKVGLRKEFADRAYWGAALRTDADGRVKAAFVLPDNLTTWRVQSWAFGKGNQFGDGQAEIVVSKDLQVRPLLPRAMVVEDELLVGALVQNLSEKPGEFQVAMEADGVAVEGAEQVVRLGPGAEGRAEWKVRPEKAGEAVFRFRARSVDGVLTDGAELAVPVSPRRVPVTAVAQGGIEKGGRDARLRLEVTEPAGGGTLRVRVEGHPALGALAVLPDLVSYPHGCAEQTLNRFLPTLIAWQAADELGLDWEAMERSFARDDWSLGWISGRGGVVAKPARLTEDRVRGMIMAGLKRLSELQSGDGAWGWFSPDDQSNAAYLTALAVRGIARAGGHGFQLKSDPVNKGVSWLRTWARQRAEVLGTAPEEVSALDAFVVHVLARVDEKGAPELREVLMELRDRLDAAGLIHLALAMDGNEGDEIRRLFTAATEAMDMVMAGLVKGPHWWEDEVELRAWYLKLLVKMEADEVVLRSGIRGLLDQRRDGVRWKSTRDSGLCVEAVIEAALACRGFGLKNGGTRAATISAAGVEQAVALGQENLWSAQVTLPLDALVMSGREIPVEVRGDGKEALTVTATVAYASTSAEQMGTAEHGIAVERRYFRVTEGGERSELQDEEVLRTGDLVEVELRMRSDGDRPFVHLRDPIPAGLEPLMELSGYSRGSYRESRTGETHFFLSELSSWNSVQRYYLRAVTAGSGLALPARAECMYAPAVFGQSARRVIVVE